jgi:putative ABC transport system permease protein
VILLISSINFTNLATARSIQRSREVGMRKVLGADRRQLIRLFLGESLLLTGLSVGLALLIAMLLLPWMNDLVGLHLTMGPLDTPYAIAGIIGLTVVLGLLAGLYPSFVLSSYRPIQSLRGDRVRGPRSTLLRDGLVTVQFALSITLLIATVVVWQQIQFMKNANLNLNGSEVVTLRLSPDDFQDRDTGLRVIEGMTEQISKLSGVVGVAVSQSAPGQYRNSNVFARPVPWEADAPLRWLYSLADARFFPLYEIEFVAGENWDPSLAAANIRSVILNETAAREAGWGAEDAIGQFIEIGPGKMQVVGVVRDFHYTSLDSRIRPLVHFYGALDSPRPGVGFISIRLAGGDVEGTLKRIHAVWEERIPEIAFDFHFVDDQYRSLYQQQERFGTLASSFAVLAVLIAGFGLLGLVSYSVSVRTKEIVVRKVLGANTVRIITLLVRGFFLPVLLANLVAWPAAWYLMRRWLEGFPYGMDLTVMPFLLSAFLAIIVAAATLLAHAVKAAKTDPVSALRYE